MAWFKHSSLLLLIPIITTGCISESLTSSVASSGSLASSASSSESSGSSSKSSNKKKDAKEKLTPEKKTYLDDVANVTNSVTGSSITSSDFMNALSRTASEDRINNWESEPSTFMGIGKGLKKAAIPSEKIGEQPFLSELIARNKDAIDLMKEGFKE